MPGQNTRICAILFAVLALQLASARAADITAFVETIGNAFTNRYPSAAQNAAKPVTRMRLFNNRIYLGHGSTATILKTAPIDCWSIDLAQDAFGEGRLRVGRADRPTSRLRQSPLHERRGQHGAGRLLPPRSRQRLANVQRRPGRALPGYFRFQRLHLHRLQRRLAPLRLLFHGRWHQLPTQRAFRHQRRRL